MSSLGKVFVVLNLVLALVVLGAAGALLQRTEVTKEDNDRLTRELTGLQQQLDEAVAQHDARARQLEQEVRTRDNRVSDLEVEREALERNVTRIQADNDQLRNQLQVISGKLDSIDTTFQSTLQANQDLVARMEDFRSQSLDAKEAQREAEAARRQAEEELAAAQRELASVDEELTAALEERRSLENQLEIAKQAGFDVTSVVAMPRIEAQVASVDPEYGFVILNKGASHGVERGFTFEVTRGGQWLGQVRVDQVYDGYATASITHPNGTMQPLDRASTYLN